MVLNSENEYIKEGRNWSTASKVEMRSRRVRIRKKAVEGDRKEGRVSGAEEEMAGRSHQNSRRQWLEGRQTERRWGGHIRF